MKRKFRKKMGVGKKSRMALFRSDRARDQKRRKKGKASGGFRKHGIRQQRPGVSRQGVATKTEDARVDREGVEGEGVDLPQCPPRENRQYREDEARTNRDCPL